MAHQITATDTMFSVLETPWHRLGTVLDNPPTVAEALQAAGLDWTVSTEPLFARVPRLGKGGDIMLVDTLVPSRAVVRDDSGEILGVVGKGFAPLQNADALAWFQPWLDSGLVSLETAGSLRGGRIVWALARIVSDPIVVRGHDTVNKYVLIAHGHDGTLAVRAGLTPIRVVCANTLGFALASGSLFRLAHRKGITDRMVEVAAAISRMDERLNEQGEGYRLLAAADVTGGEERLVEFLGAAYRQPLADVRKGRRFSEVSELFASGTGQDLPGAKGTYWGLYNALAQYTSHVSGRTPEARAHGVAFGEAREVNRRGFDAALAMATGTWSIESVMGEFSEAASIATREHPDALTA